MSPPCKDVVGRSGLLSAFMGSMVVLSCSSSSPELPAGEDGLSAMGGTRATGGASSAGVEIGGSAGAVGSSGSAGASSGAGGNPAGAGGQAAGGRSGGGGQSSLAGGTRSANGGTGASLGFSGAAVGGSAGKGGTAAGGTSATGGVAMGGASAAGAGGSTSGAGLPGVYDKEDTGMDCPKPALPAYGELPSTASLPDPFQMSAGTRMMRREEWRCRRAEIGAKIQKYELGSKPPAPSSLTATFAGGVLTVKISEGANAITLSASVSTPSGAGPFPAMIGMDTGGTGSLPASIFTSRGIATITFKSSQLTPQSPKRGEGAIYKLYPDPKVGSMILWAWGVSRIIDGLEKTAAENKLDLKRLAVTGCSYAGKMALYAGAFDERIALTIPQESGGGGEAAWRVSGTMSGTEDLSHAQGTSWYYQDLTQFNSTPAKLPFDQHLLAAMVAPRALLAIGNPDIAYLASEAGYVSMRAASEVYKALGVSDRIGFSQVGGHGHCAFPASQTADVAAFVDKFLLGKAETKTNIAVTPYKTDLSKWISWETPQLL